MCNNIDISGTYSIISITFSDTIILGLSNSYIINNLSNGLVSTDAINLG